MIVIPRFSPLIACWASSLRSKGFHRPGMDGRGALRLEALDLRLDGGDLLGRGEDFERGLGGVTAAGRKGHHPVARLLERQRVGIVRAGLQAGDVAVAQAGGVLPERKRRELVGAESE